MALFSPSRCVLILGDEGLQIYNVTRLSAKFIDFVPWDTVEFVTSVRDLIVKKCKRKPIVILNDMVEQHYRKERIPKVSFMDRSNVLKRRLGVTFPNYRVRAALKVKDKKFGASKDVKSDTYLFAATPNSNSLNKTLEAIRLSSAPIIGFYLLPVEAADMVKTLSHKFAKGRRHKAVWTIFAGQHHNGGLRQVVTRGGELALTRMTPIVDTDIEPELWAKEVSEELSATMSYLSRFGYDDSDGLDVILIANEAVQISLEAAVDIECNLKVLTSQQAGAIIGAVVGKQDDLRYADPLHAAFLGRKVKFQLPMQSPAIDRLTQPRRVAAFLTWALLAGCAYFGFSTFQNWKKLIELNDQLVVTVQQNQSLKQEYDREIAKKKEIGFDFLLVNNSIEVFKQLEKQKVKPLPMFREIGRSLGTDLRLDKIMVKLEGVKDDDNEYAYVPDQAREDKLKHITNAVMTISFPSSISPETGVQKVSELRDRLQDNLPDYNVEIIKQVADLSYTGNFIGEAGRDNSQEGVPESYDAEIQVRREIR